MVLSFLNDKYLLIKMKHLTENGYTYFEHLKIAFKLSFRCFIVGVKLFVHGVFPSIWEDTGWKKLGKGS